MHGRGSRKGASFASGAKIPLRFCKRIVYTGDVVSSQVLSIRLEPAIHEWLETVADERAVKVGVLARDLIVEGLTRAGTTSPDPMVRYSNGRSMLNTAQSMMDAAIAELAGGKEGSDDR